MMDNIPTWTERCEVHPDHQSGMVTNAMIQMRMQEEIDGLRAENARLREALEEIANAPVPDTRFNGRGYVPDFDGFKPIARAALAEKEST